MSQKKLDSISHFLHRPVDASTVGAFRILFGAIMAWEIVRFYSLGWINGSLIYPKFHFTYELFPWVAPWPGDGMYYHFAVMGVAGLMVALGLFYRFAAILLFFTYAHFLLIDKTYFNNHYYFICLVCFLFCFINANRWMALDNLWKRKPGPRSIPWWNLFILKAQTFIVYFYGGIAKINADWLRGEPLRHWLIEPAEREGVPQAVADFLKSEFGVYFFSYTGLIFDLAIGFLLWSGKTRLLGFGLILIFNLTNNWLFTIGVFPFLMIGATVLFLKPDTPRNVVEKIFPKLKKGTPEAWENRARFPRATVIFFSIYMTLQILIPLRHWLYEGQVNWTEEGHRFSWFMKLRAKTDCQLNFIATDPQTGKTWPIFPEGHLTFSQFKQMCLNPNMIIQYAHFLGNELEKGGMRDPIIKIRSLISLNYRPRQAMIDPNVNMMDVDYPLFSHADWIIPLKK